MRSRLGRIIRDIDRKTEGQPTLEEASAPLLLQARQNRSQQQRQRGWKLYSFHAPEIECIGNGKARAPYEYGVRYRSSPPMPARPADSSWLHAEALPGNSY